MAIKISQFNSLPTVDGTIIVPVVDPSPANTSFRTTVADLQTFILNGNAATATKLFQSVNINSVAFDGSADITVTADANTLTGTTLKSTVVNSSLTSVGTLGNLTVTNTISGSINGNAATVTNGVYTTDIGTVTNLMLAGSIANNKLSYNTVTFNGVEVALGGTGSITTAIPPATTSTLGGVIIGPAFSAAVDGTLSIHRLFHGFSVTSTGDLIYSTTSDPSILLQDQYGNDLYEDTDIGTNDYSYSMDIDGNLIVSFV